MSLVFADTLYWNARIIPNDPWSEPGRQAYLKLSRGTVLLTTEEVFVEVLAAVSSLGSFWRVKATSLIRTLHSTNQVRICVQSHDSFLSGLGHYEARQDKGFSLVDCISMQTMRKFGITDILTNDHHFTQEGFNILIPKKE